MHVGKGEGAAFAVLPYFLVRSQPSRSRLIISSASTRVISFAGGGCLMLACLALSRKIAQLLAVPVILLSSILLTHPYVTVIAILPTSNSIISLTLSRFRQR